MKKNKSKLLSIIFIFMLILTACGINSKERMSIDSNFKGERIIQLTIDADTFNRANGGKDAIIAFLSENTFEPLTLNYVKDEPSFIEVEYSIKFENKEDYINKINTLYEMGSVQEEVELNFKYEDQGFNKGVEFYDNSNVQNLLSPLVNKAIENGLIYEQDLSRLWNTKEYSLAINDNLYIENSTSSYGTYSEKEYMGPKTINVITSKSDQENKFNREISLYFDEEKFHKLDNNWEDFFITSENVKFEENSENKSAKFIYENFTQEQINKETSHFFGVKSNFSMINKNNGEKLKLTETLKDSIPENELSKTTNIQYLYYFDQKNIDSYPKGEYLSEEDNVDRIIKASSWELNEGIEKSIETDVVFDKIEIQTSLNDKNINRSLTFPKKNQEEIVNKNLTAYLKSLGVNYSDSKDNLKIEYTYDFEKGSQVHSKLFSSVIEVKKVEGSLFKSKQEIFEEAIFKGLKFRKIEHISKKVSLTEIQDQQFKQDNQNSYTYSIAFETGKVSSIVLVLSILFIIILVIFLVFRILGKSNKNLRDTIDKDLDKNIKQNRKNLDKSNRRVLDDSEKMATDDFEKIEKNLQDSTTTSTQKEANKSKSVEENNGSIS